ncbi:response regulator [bacterium]|nr:response regulator [bacterium]
MSMNSDPIWLTLLDGIEDAVAVIARDGTLQGGNLSFRRLVGMPLEGSLPKSTTFGDFIENLSSIPSLDELAASPKRFWAGDATLRRTDGQERKASCRIEPMRSPDSAVSGFVVTLIEDTDRKAHQARFRLFELAVAQSLEPVLITEAEPIDTPGPRIVYANKSFTKVTGYSLEEVLGQTPRILQGPKSDRNELDRIRFALERWKPVRAELLNYRKNGEEFWVELVIFPVADETGWFTHWVAVQREITEKKMLEQGLKAAKDDAERANRAKTRFLANMSHEIRTPLTAILGYAEILLDPDTEKPKHDENVKSIRRNGKHLLEIVGNVLDLSKIEAGKYQPLLVSESPFKIAHDVIEAQSVLASEKGLRLSTRSVGPIPVSCLIDAASVRQILMNLVSNAIKFTGQGGHVEVQVRAERSEVCENGNCTTFSVIDDGCGIDPNEIDRLFEAFEQADNTTSRKFGGAGLGLNICRRLVEILGGSIKVTSEPGKGSRFDVTIPCRMPPDDLAADAQEVAVVARATSARKQIPQLTGRVLIVDDSADNRKIIGYFITPTGLAIDMAENGHQAIQKAFEKDYRAILLDMQMPEVDGYTAAAELRRLGYDRPIIALTAHALSEDRQRCLEVGCTDYLAKPLGMAELHAMLARYLGPDRDEERTYLS